MDEKAKRAGELLRTIFDKYVEMNSSCGMIPADPSQYWLQHERDKEACLKAMGNAWLELQRISSDG